MEIGLILDHLFRFAVAFVLALPLGIERERSGEVRSAGLRTFPLVSAASCAFILIGRHAFGPTSDALSRVLYGLMTGMGFIGGGAILKKGHSVQGTATAAAIWATGAIGAAVGFGFYHLAIAVSAATAAVFYAAPRAKKKMDEKEKDDG